jgi:hypothetical protein
MRLRGVEANASNLATRKKTRISAVKISAPSEQHRQGTSTQGTAGTPKAKGQRRAQGTDDRPKTQAVASSPETARPCPDCGRAGPFQEHKGALFCLTCGSQVGPSGDA